jgi:hypothetical protein
MVSVIGAGRAPRVRVVGVAAMVGALALGCHSEFDSGREEIDTGSFGTTVHTLVCKRMAYHDDLAGGGTVDVRGDGYRDICRLGLAPPAEASGHLKALQAERQLLIGAVDAVFPDGFLPDLQTFLTSNDFLGLYDDDTATARWRRSSGWVIDSAIDRSHRLLARCARWSIIPVSTIWFCRSLRRSLRVEQPVANGRI